MKSIKHITLGAIITLGIFGTALYSSCAKDECKGTTCLNKGTCNGGLCKCPTGIDGVNCELIYSQKYSGAYRGLPPDDPTSDTTNMLIFTPSDDTTNFNKMEMLWIDTAGLTVVQLPIELNSPSTSAANFTITETTKNFITYTGSGSVSSSITSVVLNLRYGSGAVVTRYFNNYQRQ